MSDVRQLDYTDLTDTEAFDLWLSACPVDYNWQEDDYEDEENVYEIYAFRLNKEEE